MSKPDPLRVRDTSEDSRAVRIYPMTKLIIACLAMSVIPIGCHAVREDQAAHSREASPPVRKSATQPMLTDSEYIDRATKAFAEIRVDVSKCRPVVTRWDSGARVRFWGPEGQRGGGGEAELSADGTVLRRSVWR